MDTTQTTDASQQDDSVIDHIYSEVVAVFGGNTPAGGDQENAGAFEELTAKALKYAKDNGIALYDGFVHDHAQDIQSMPDIIEGKVSDVIDGSSSLSGEVSQFKKDTNTYVKYTLFALAALFISILVEKYAKAVAAAGLIVIAVLLFKYYTNKSAKTDTASTPQPV